MTTFIKLNNVSVEYPVFGWHGRSIKKIIISKAVGGIFNSDLNTGAANVIALDQINLDIKSGCRVGLTGHNGAGKTTLLRTICGIYHPTTGVAITKGNINSLINIMLGVDHESTGRENIKLRGLMMGLSKKKIDEMADEIIEFSGLNDYIDLPVRTYSSGMALRLAFSIATTIDSDILIMDEWLSVGDPEFMVRAENRLLQRVRESKILVMASHNNELINRICNRKIELEHGRIVSDHA